MEEADSLPPPPDCDVSRKSQEPQNCSATPSMFFRRDPTSFSSCRCSGLLQYLWTACGGSFSSSVVSRRRAAGFVLQLLESHSGCSEMVQRWRLLPQPVFIRLLLMPCPAQRLLLYYDHMCTTQYFCLVNTWTCIVIFTITKIWWNTNFLSDKSLNLQLMAK